MKRVLGGSLVLPLCLSMGCSTSGGGSAPNASGASGNNGGVGSSGANGGYNPGAGYNATGSGGTAPSATGTVPFSVDGGCAGDQVDAQLTQVNILFLLDKSGSMGFQNSVAAGTWDNCADRWNPVESTLLNFFQQPDSGRLYASLSFLPADGDNTAICSTTTYSSGSAALKVPLTLLDANGQQKFASKLCPCANGSAPSSSSCIVPSGGTPTRPALSGTIKYKGTVDSNYPDSKTVIVLITDGEPSFACTNSAGATQVCNSCDDLTNGCLSDATKCLAQTDEVDKIRDVILANQQTVPLSTTIKPYYPIYVVGVGTNLSDTTLSEWATASHNDAIDLRSLSGSEAAAVLMAKLQSIRASSISCEFAVPKPKSGDNIDPSKTFVHYTDGSGNGIYLAMTADGTSSTCSTSAKTWYFDKPTLPTKITLCPTACDALQQDPKGFIQVEYGCQHFQPIY